MQTIFSTSGVRTAEAFDSFMAFVRANLENTVTAEVFGEQFYAHLKTGRLADISIAAWKCPRGISRSSRGDDLILALPSGRRVIEFPGLGRSFELNRNTVSLIDHHEPCVVRSIDPPRRLQVRLPRSELGHLLVNQPIALNGNAALLAAFVHELARIGPSILDELGRNAARNFILEMTARSFSQHDAGPAPAPSVFAAGAAGYEFARKVMQADILDAEQIAGQTARALADAAARRRTSDPSAEPSDRQPRRQEDS